jgi:ATP-binding cassette subfamily C protein
MGKTIEVDGRNTLTLTTLNSAYVVEDGWVYLHFQKKNQEGIKGRKNFIVTVKKGEYFLFASKPDYIVTATGQLNTRVRELDFEAVPHQHVKDFYKKLDIPYDGDVVKSNDALLERLDRALIDTLRNEADNAEKSRLQRADIRRKSYFSIKHLITNKKDSELDHLGGEDSLYDAVRLIADHMKMGLAPLKEIKNCIPEDLTVEDIARISRFPIRDIILDDKWYMSDGGCILAYMKEDSRPLALIPMSPSKYKVYDVEKNETYILTKALAKKIIPRGTMFYKSFGNEIITKSKLLSFGVSLVWKRDIFAILFLMLIGTLIGIIFPELNRLIFDEYVPEGQLQQIMQIGGVIIAFTLGNFFFSLIKSFATFRASNNMEYTIQMAVFDRIMNFPSRVYEEYSSGELASRASGITTIFNTLADVIVSTVLSAIFSLFYLYRMTVYSTELSKAGVVMVFVSITIMLTIGFLQLRYEKRLIEIQNQIAGLMYQLILGVIKLRLSGAEERGVNLWQKQFLDARKIVLKKEKMTRMVSVFTGFVSVIFSIVLYKIVLNDNTDISFGQFTAFTAAFGSFSGAMTSLAKTFISVNNLIPIYDKAKVILETVPEYSENAELPSDLRGKIELSNIDFKYDENGDYVIKDLNLTIREGEYIGIVGSSGSGKSTLLKLLLGFITPIKGAIFYDDKDMENYDKRELRKKLGVVLQDSEIIAGSIYENIIVNNSRISLTAVREVVKKVGLDKDISAMPMGLHTVLTEDGGTISGGQKQRILIARAIANDPQIIYFDEATSALDNITQKLVSDSLDQIKATKIVIAHRLSTIINCDRILVMENGRIVEEGSYEDLFSKKGRFYQLAVRQMA